MMTRRGLLRGLLAGAVLGVARVLPMPLVAVASVKTLLQWQQDLPVRDWHYTVRLLTQRNELLDEMVFVENPEPGHRVKIRTPLPSVEWRQQ